MDGFVLDNDSFNIVDYQKGTDSKTPCPKCSALIPRSATACQFCGHHFRGRAEDFTPEANEYQRRDFVLRRLGLAVLVVIGLVFLGCAIAVMLGA